LNANPSILRIDALPGLQFSINAEGRSLGLLASATPGDIDLNGLVGFSDLLILARNYGTSTMPTSPDEIGIEVWSDFHRAMQLVPEPGVMGLITSIGLVAIRSRRPISPTRTTRSNGNIKSLEC
jgi:hypothetical protein